MQTTFESSGNACAGKKKKKVVTTLTSSYKKEIQETVIQSLDSTTPLILEARKYFHLRMQWNLLALLFVYFSAPPGGPSRLF